MEDQPVVRDQLVGQDYESSPINWTEEERHKLEKKFLRKLDLRMSILVIVRGRPCSDNTMSTTPLTKYRPFWHSDLHS